VSHFRQRGDSDIGAERVSGGEAGRRHSIAGDCGVGGNIVEERGRDINHKDVSSGRNSVAALINRGPGALESVLSRAAAVDASLVVAHGNAVGDQNKVNAGSGSSDNGTVAIVRG